MESLSILLSISITLYQCSNGHVSSSYWIADHDIDYSTTFDGNEKWFSCPENYVIGGFYKSDAADLGRDDISSIEKIRCVRPNTTIPLFQSCLEKDVDIPIHVAGNWDYNRPIYCPDDHFINGIYSRTEDDCGFECWDKFMCCEYTNGYDANRGAGWGYIMGDVQYQDNDLDSCLAKDNVWCNVSNQSFINGFAISGYDDTFSITPYTRSFHQMIWVDVTVAACDGWNYGSISNSMRMQISDIYGTSEFFYVNKRSELPTNGSKKSYSHQLRDLADLHNVKIMVDDQQGFCISALEIYVSIFGGWQKKYIGGREYFGSGIILTNHCDYSYAFVSDNLPLIPCKTGFLDLSTYAPRGIYQLGIHSCIGDNKGISVDNMREYVYATIMGKDRGNKIYTTTTVSYLDHIKPAEVNIMELGDLIAANVLLLTETPKSGLYSKIQGTLIGIKIEALNDQSFPSNLPAFYVRINGKLQTISMKQVFDGYDYDDYTIDLPYSKNQYLVMFFAVEDRVKISKSDEIQIYAESVWSIVNHGVSNVRVNVFGIFEGKEEEYALSFRIHGDSAINWFDANDKCKDEYGTSLASIHSQEENFLIAGFMGHGNAWIGLQDITNKQQNNWLWKDQSSVDYTSWAPDEPNSGEDCALIYFHGTWNDLDCNDARWVEKYVCASPHWPANAHRTFEINVPELIDDITLVSIGNNNQQDNLCIDSVNIDGKTATYLSDNIIGGNTGPSALSAIIKYPVCKTEVIGFRVDYEASNATLIGGDSTIAGLQCKNANRLIPSTCSISQSYELSKTTSFAISNENSATAEYSWGSSSSVSLGTSSSTSTSDEFSYGFDQSVSIGVSATVGFETDFFVGSASASVETSVETSLGSNQQWTSSTEKSQESSTETTNENNQQNTESNTATDGTESAWDTTETTTIECNAEIEVPPSHSVSYALIFNAYNTSITTYTDMKLTLCSAFTDPANSNDSSHYVYLKDIKGVINHKETTACEVQFNPATYIRNAMTCDNEQRLAFSSGSNYVPRCREDEPKLYDGCQCDIGDTETLAQCMCVDETGNMLTNKFMYVEDGDDWRRICVEELKCADSSVVNVSQ